MKKSSPSRKNNNGRFASPDSLFFKLFHLCWVNPLTKVCGIWSENHPTFHKTWLSHLCAYSAQPHRDKSMLLTTLPWRPIPHKMYPFNFSEKSLLLEFSDKDSPCSGSIPLTCIFPFTQNTMSTDLEVCILVQKICFFFFLLIQ